jgi:hypothetical protein
MRRRHPGTAGSVVFPTVAIAAGILSILCVAATSGMLTFSRISPVAEANPGAHPTTPLPASPAPAQVPAVAPQNAAPAPAPTPVEEPIRPEANQLTMAQALGTLQFVLKQTRGPDGLQSPALGVTSSGGVVDPFSATPQRILIVLPANTTLSYTVSVDRQNYAVTLTDDTVPNVVARYDTVNGRIQFG